MQELTIALGITAALLHIIAYILYNKQMRAGQSQPNIASWSIWAFLAILSAFTYHEMSGDTVAALQFFAGSVACVVTFFYALGIGKFSWPRLKEWGLFGLGVLAAFVWWIFRSATGANIIIVIAFVISFIPTLEGVLRDPFRETPMSWMFWALAFFVTSFNVILREGKFIALLAPVVLLFAHGSIAVLSTQKRKERFRDSFAQS